MADLFNLDVMLKPFDELLSVAGMVPLGGMLNARLMTW